MSYRDERTAARDKIDSLERENADLKEMLSNALRKIDGPPFGSWFMHHAISTLAIVGLGFFLLTMLKLCGVIDDFPH